MRKQYLLIMSLFLGSFLSAQTTLTEAVDFKAKTIHGETIELFDYLDAGKLVVIDFFSTSCGPCGEFAPQIQASFEDFGSNEGNVIFLGMCWGDDNAGVAFFDSLHGVTYPSVSGFEGGGNAVVNMYNIISYPTVLLIHPDRTILNPYIWEPTTVNINAEVLAAGGMMVGLNETAIHESSIQLYPNPARNNTKIVLDETIHGELEIIIYDVLGNEIQKNFVKKLDSNQEFNVSLGHINEGFYIIAIKKYGKLIAKKALITYQ
jgi:thiol-disulfide isomerase/thioredoxin